MIIKKILILIATILISTSFVSASQVTNKQDSQFKYKPSYIVSYHYNVQGCLEKNIEVIYEPKIYTKKVFLIQDKKMIKSKTQLKTFNQPYTTIPKNKENKITKYKMGCNY